MVEPPRRDPRYRRYWGYYNRPFAGFGCLYTIIAIALIWFLLSFFIDALVIW